MQLLKRGYFCVIYLFVLNFKKLQTISSADAPNVFLYVNDFPLCLNQNVYLNNK